MSSLLHLCSSAGIGLSQATGLASVSLGGWSLSESNSQQSSLALKAGEWVGLVSLVNFLDFLNYFEFFAS